MQLKKIANVHAGILCIPQQDQFYEFLPKNKTYVRPEQGFDSMNLPKTTWKERHATNNFIVFQGEGQTRISQFGERQAMQAEGHQEVSET